MIRHTISQISVQRYNFFLTYASAHAFFYVFICICQKFVVILQRRMKGE